MASVLLPDGSTYPILEGKTPQEAMLAALEKYPEAFGFAPSKPKEDTSGFTAAASAGGKRLLGEAALTAGKLGIMGLPEAEKYYKEQEAAAAQRFTPTQDDWSTSPWLKFKETLGGSLPYMAAPLAAGVAATTLPVSGVLSTAALGALGAGAVSTGQFTGSNLARQMEPGKTLEETDLGKAALTAVPMAALDTAAMFLAPGLGKLLGAAGREVTEVGARALANQTLKQVALDYTKATGKAMTAEGLTEAAQQLLERAQAGLDISDPAARKEYLESLQGGAALALVLGPFGRAAERSGIKAQGKALETKRLGEEQAAADAAKAEADAAEAARKQTPEYLRDLHTQYQALEQEKQALPKIVKPKKVKDASAEQELAYEDALKTYEAAVAAKKEFIERYKPVKQEYKERFKDIQALQVADQTQEALQGGAGPMAQPLLPGFELGAAQPGAAEQLAAEQGKRQSELSGLEQQAESTQLALAEAQRTGDTARVAALSDQLEGTNRQLEATRTQYGQMFQQPTAEAAPVSYAGEMENVQAGIPTLESLQAKQKALTDTLTKAKAAKVAPVHIKSVTDQLSAVQQDIATLKSGKPLGMTPAQTQAQQMQRVELMQQRDTLAKAYTEISGRAMKSAVPEEQRALFNQAVQVKTALVEADAQLKKLGGELPTLDALKKKEVELTNLAEKAKTAPQKQAVLGKLIEVRQQIATFAAPTVEGQGTLALRPRATPVASTLAPNQQAELFAQQRTETAGVEGIKAAEQERGLYGAEAKRESAKQAFAEQVRPEFGAEAAPATREDLQKDLFRLEELEKNQMDAAAGVPHTEYVAAVAKAETTRKKINELQTELAKFPAAQKETAAADIDALEAAKAAEQEKFKDNQKLGATDAAKANVRKIERLDRKIEEAKARPVQTTVEEGTAAMESALVEKVAAGREAAAAQRLADTRAEAQAKADTAALAEKAKMPEIAREVRVARQQNQQKQKQEASRQDAETAIKERQERRVADVNRQRDRKRAPAVWRDMAAPEAAPWEKLSEARREEWRNLVADGKASMAEADRLSRVRPKPVAEPQTIKQTAAEAAAETAEKERISKETAEANRIAEELKTPSEKTRKQRLQRETERAEKESQRLMQEQPELFADEPAVAEETTPEVKEGTNVLKGGRKYEARVTKFPSAEERQTQLDIERLAAESPADILTVEEVEARAATAREQTEAERKRDLERFAAESNQDVALRENNDLYDAFPTNLISPDGVSAAEDGNFTGLLEAIGESSTPFNRKLVKSLQETLKAVGRRPKLILVENLKDKGVNVAGLYDPVKNRIYIDNRSMHEETVLHEAVHAVTLGVLRADPNTLTAEQRAARSELESLYANLKDDPAFAREYGKKNVEEFVAELMTNANLREKIDAVKPGFLQRFYQAIMRMLGMEPKSLSEQAMASAFKIFQPPSPMAKDSVMLPSIMRGVFSGTKAVASSNVAQGTVDTVNALVGRSASLGDKITASAMGLRLRTRIADNWAPIEALLKLGVSKGKVAAAQALQLRLLMRVSDDTSRLTQLSLTTGPAKIKRNADGVKTIQGQTGGPSALKIAEALKGSKLGNAHFVENLFTTWLAILRAERDGIGYEKLNFGKDADGNPILNAEKAKGVKATVESDPDTKKAFADARDIYRQYNRELLQMYVDSGMMAQSKADALIAGDYVPYYRIDKGLVQLFVGGSKPVTIGSIIDQPQLKELVGGEDKILPIFSGMVQNTSLLVRSAVRNMQTKDVGNLLQDLGMAKIIQGEGPRDVFTARFNDKGVQHYVRLDEEAFPEGIPADVVIMGMQGIKTAIPAGVRMMGVPANLLRKGITRLPTYAYRQLIRDPIHAYMTTGGDFSAVLDTYREFAKSLKGDTPAGLSLKQAGAISSDIYAGSQEDVANMLRDVTAGKSGWGFNGVMAKLDTLGLKADAATRAALYNNFRKKGMSHLEAVLGAAEAMNFSRRGTSASLHWLSTMIPFFNSQIQGLDAVYRAAVTGDTTFQEKLDARAKLWKRGALMFGMTFAYAAMMQDDEAYKTATPLERAQSWFLRIPGIDEPLRIPIPFEPGLAFKVIPEMIFNTAAGDTKARDALDAFGKMLVQSQPIGLPAGVKPLIELAANKNFYADAPIISQREAGLTTDQQFRTNTTELAKLLGKTGLVSPVSVDHLIRGYTGGLGILLASMANYPLRPLVSPNESDKPAKALSEMPVIGSLFQPATGRGVVEAAFKDVEEFRKAAGTYQALLKSGNRADAAAFADKHAREIALNSTGGAFRQQMGELATLRRQIETAPGMSSEQKQAQIKRIKEMQIQLATMIRQMSSAP